MLFMMTANFTYAQVRGTVKDKQGEPIPGANVFWMGTTSGVTSSAEGRFSIEKPAKSHMLVVSFIGFVNDTHTLIRTCEFITNITAFIR